MIKRIGYGEMISRYGITFDFGKYSISFFNFVKTKKEGWIFFILDIQERYKK